MIRGVGVCLYSHIYVTCICVYECVRVRVLWRVRPFYDILSHNIFGTAAVRKSVPNAQLAYQMLKKRESPPEPYMQRFFLFSSGSSGYI